MHAGLHCACPETSAANLYGQNGYREVTPGVHAPVRIRMTHSNEKADMSCDSCRRYLGSVSGKARDKGALFCKTLLDILSLVIGKLRSQEPHIAIDVALMSAQVREISFSHEYKLRSRRRSAACLALPMSRSMSLQGPGYSSPNQVPRIIWPSRPASAVKINKACPG
jgi:hypothetical protein